MTPGYRALRDSFAAIDLSARGRIRITGEDRVRLLHAMASNDIQHLAAGSGRYTFFLTAQGRILCDSIVLAFDDYLLLSTEPEARQLLYEHMDKYIIADDVTLEDVTDTTVEIAVEGPAADPPVALSPDLYAHAAWDAATVVRETATGQSGWRVIAAAGAVPSLGASPATSDDTRSVRIENGVPRFPEDFNERHLAHETQLLHAVSFDKGCYLGQEIVERVRSRGGVHRFLMRIAAPSALPAGTKLTAAGNDAGEVTSMVFSPALGRAAGFAYVRTGQVPAGTPLAAGEVPVDLLSGPVTVAQHL